MKNIWNYFKGKKRNIGVIAIWVLKATTTFFPDLLPIEHQIIIRDGIDVLLLSGTADALGRTDTGKEIINKSIDKGKEYTNKALSIIKIK